MTEPNPFATPREELSENDTSAESFSFRKHRPWEVWVINVVQVGITIVLGILVAIDLWVLRENGFPLSPEFLLQKRASVYSLPIIYSLITFAFLWRKKTGWYFTTWTFLWSLWSVALALGILMLFTVTNVDLGIDSPSFTVTQLLIVVILFAVFLLGMVYLLFRKNLLRFFQIGNQSSKAILTAHLMGSMATLIAILLLVKEYFPPIFLLIVLTGIGFEHFISTQVSKVKKTEE
ncbi:Hypothetical protein PBC10988_30650 [Planctomycetales bacterium 10988]|nr:Hypothetical protein PBC10988_30650 [Planctomycetales bacterium 10988]